MYVSMYMYVCIYEAHHSFLYNDQIIIKPADKGTTVVVWSKDDFLLEASNQLSDTSVYQNVKEIH